MLFRSTGLPAQNPVVSVAGLGHAYGANPDRGVCCMRAGVRALTAPLAVRADPRGSGPGTGGDEEGKK